MVVELVMMLEWFEVFRGPHKLPPERGAFGQRKQRINGATNVVSPLRWKDQF